MRDPRQQDIALGRAERDIERLRDEDFDVSYPQRFFMRTPDGERFQLLLLPGPSFALVEDDGTVHPIGVSGSAAWGAILGILADQTDLQDALDEKLSYTDNFNGWGAGNKLADADNLIIGGGGHGMLDMFRGAAANATGGFYAATEDESIWAQFNKAPADPRFTFRGSHDFEFQRDIIVPDEAFGPAWNGSLDVPTKNAIFDAVDTDTALTANSDVKVPSQKAVKSYIDAAVAGLLDLKGNQDCSANPNYPAALKGDAYYVTVAGKIGGAAGKSVDIGDVFVAKADNAGGTEAAVGGSWFVLEHNLTGALFAANNLNDVGNVVTARANLGLAIGADVQAYSANLSAYAGAAWAAGVQVPTLTAANTVVLKTVGAAAGNLLDKASGDSLYQPVGTYPYMLAQSAVAVSVTGTLVETIFATIAVPAGAMGANGQITVIADFSFTNSGSNKTMRVKLGAATLMSLANAAADGSVAEVQISNRNAANSQRWTAKRTASTGTGTYAAGTAAQDTATALNLVITGQLANVGDTLTLESYQVIVSPKA